jgi:SNF2 family DNA or RNA helicase
MTMVIDGDVPARPVEHYSPTQVLIHLLDTLVLNGSRILVFALHEEHLRTALPPNVQRLSGHVQTRQRQITAFRQGVQQILLLNSLQACAGMHLPETTDVIFLHRPPQDLEKQCVGRAYRLGRTMDLHVHYILPQEE